MTSLPDAGDDRIIERAWYWSAVVMVFVAAIAFSILRPFTAQRVTSPAFGKQSLPTYPPDGVSSARSTIPYVPLIDVTLESGIDFVHDRGKLGNLRLPEAMGGGCVVFDYDLDGDQDILFIHSAVREMGRSSLALYANDGQGHFRDVTDSAGLMLAAVGMGGSVADFDNDGWPDLFITCLGPNCLFQNLGGSFREITVSAGVSGENDAWSLGSCWLDFDRDGDLDLFVGNYLKWSADLDEKLNCRRNGVDRSYCDPDLFAGTQPYFYQNEGDATFREISSHAGVEVRNSDTGQAVPKSLAAISVDLNDDGWPDLVVVGDGAPNLAFVNSQEGTFHEDANRLGFAFDRLGQPTRSFGIDSAVFDEDDSLAFCFGGRGNALKSLYVRRRGESLFTDHGIISGFGAQSRLFQTFGVCFVDVDLDGCVDILASNGQIHEDFDQLQQSQTWKQSPQLYWQSPTRPTRFQMMLSSECGHDLGEPLAGRGATFADFDSDGDLDLLLTAIGGKPRLLRNDQQLNRNWLRVVLHGRNVNRDALGARVEIHAGSRKLVRTAQPVGGYLTQHESALTFGLDQATSIETVLITWPDGSLQQLSDVPANQILFVVESEPSTSL